MVRASDNEFPSVLLDEQASAPSTPASGFWRVYAKSDGLYLVDDAGTETGPLGAAAGGSGDLTLIDQVTLGSAGVIDFTSIPGTYETLILEVVGRAGLTGTSIQVPALLFGDSTFDTGSNYGYRVVDSTSASASFASAELWPVRTCLPQNGSDAHYFGAFKVWIPQYADTSKWRNVRGEGGGPNQTGSEVRWTYGNGVWKNTADPISRIRVMLQAGDNLATGSVATLYGRG